MRAHCREPCEGSSADSVSGVILSSQGPVDRGTPVFSLPPTGGQSDDALEPARSKSHADARCGFQRHGGESVGGETEPQRVPRRCRHQLSCCSRCAACRTLGRARGGRPSQSGGRCGMPHESAHAGARHLDHRHQLKASSPRTAGHHRVRCGFVADRAILGRGIDLSTSGVLAPIAAALTHRVWRALAGCALARSLARQSALETLPLGRLTDFSSRRLGARS